MLVVKNPPANAGDLRQKFDSWVGRFPGGGHCNPLQVGCLENPWTEEPGSLWSIGLERVSHDWSVSSHAHTHPEKSIKLKNTLFSSYIGKSQFFCILYFFPVSLLYYVHKIPHFQHFWSPNEWRSFPTIILCDTCGESKNLTQFLYKIHGDSVRFHTLRAQP